MEIAKGNFRVQQWAVVAQMRVFGGSLGVAASFIVLNSRIAKTLTRVLTAKELEDFYRSPLVVESFDFLKQLRPRTSRHLE
jgi:hypothetical protein